MKSIVVILLAGLSLVAGAIYLETSPCWSSLVLSGSVWGVHFADITGDRYPEVIVVGEPMPCYLFSNDSGTFSTNPVWQSNAADRTVWASFGDYDNDEDLDMAVANYYMMGGHAKVYRNDNGTLNPDAVWTASTGGGDWCEWGDVDNDGDLDLAICDLFANPMVFRNNGGVLETSPFWVGTDYNIDFGGAWIDVDLDGDLDLVISGINASEPVHRLYYNNNGTLESSASWSSLLGSENVGALNAVGDIDKDGWPDLAAPLGLSANDNPNVIYSNISGTLEQTPSWFSSDAHHSTSCALGDINGDGYLDWAVNNENYKCVVYENAGGTLNTTPVWESSAYGSIGVDLGDVDQDGVIYREDTVIADGAKKLFYLSALPVNKFDGITINGDSVPTRKYCYSPRAAWVSFQDSIAAGNLIIFKYSYSTDLELIHSDYANSQAHMYQNNVGIVERISKPMDIGFEVFPNPVVNNNLQFSYTIKSPDRVCADIYDASGRKVAPLFDKIVPAGCHREKISVSLVPGIYFLKIETDHASFTKKIVYIR
jgi:hypothetical protein